MSIVCTSLVMERRREVKSVSNSCCMWSSMVDLTGEVETLMQSTFMFLYEKVLVLLTLINYFTLLTFEKKLHHNKAVKLQF